MEQLAESPEQRGAMEDIISHVNAFIRGQDNPTPVGAAIELHDVLVLRGVKPSEEDEVFYNFDDQYKVKFTEDGRDQVAVFWAPWIGGVSWRIEDNV